MPAIPDVVFCKRRGGVSLYGTGNGLPVYDKKTLNIHFPTGMMINKTDHTKAAKSLLLSLTLALGASGTLFAQNQRTDGYKGIWYTIEQSSEYGYKYSGGLGTYTADHIPVAVYSPEADKTFFLYGGTTQADERHLLVMISYYDHKKKVVPRPVVVCDKNGVDDPHDNGSLAIDEEGYIWVFVSGRNVTRLGAIYKSAEPYSIDRFEKIHETVMTYPQPWRIGDKGFLHLFTKYTAPETRGRELYWSVSADGKNWTPDRKLAGIEGHYQISNARDNRVVTAFNFHPGGSADTRTNLYVLQTSDMGETWTTMDGTRVETPLTEIRNSALVYDCRDEGKLVYLNDINFDKEGNPVVLAIVSRHYQPGPKGNPHEWILFHWQGSEWKQYKVCESTHNYDMGSLYIDGDTWTIVGPTEPGPQYYGTGGEMAIWTSRNAGKSWKRTRTVTANSERNHSYARRPVNAHKDFYAFWADGNADKMSESHLYFTDKSGRKVWELPYNMDTEFAAPRRVKFKK